MNTLFVQHILMAFALFLKDSSMCAICLAAFSMLYQWCSIHVWLPLKISGPKWCILWHEWQVMQNYNLRIHKYKNEVVSQRTVAKQVTVFLINGAWEEIKSTINKEYCRPFLALDSNHDCLCTSAYGCFVCGWSEKLDVLSVIDTWCCHVLWKGSEAQIQSGVFQVFI